MQLTSQFSVLLLHPAEQNRLMNALLPQHPQLLPSPLLHRLLLLHFARGHDPLEDGLPPRTSVLFRRGVFLVDVRHFRAVSDLEKSVRVYVQVGFSQELVWDDLHVHHGRFGALLARRFLHLHQMSEVLFEIALGADRGRPGPEAVRFAVGGVVMRRIRRRFLF